MTKSGLGIQPRYPTGMEGQGVSPRKLESRQWLGRGLAFHSGDVGWFWACGWFLQAGPAPPGLSVWCALWKLGEATAGPQLWAQSLPQCPGPLESCSLPTSAPRSCLLKVLSGTSPGRLAHAGLIELWPLPGLGSPRPSNLSLGWRCQLLMDFCCPIRAQRDKERSPAQLGSGAPAAGFTPAHKPAHWRREEHLLMQMPFEKLQS